MATPEDSLLVRALSSSDRVLVTNVTYGFSDAGQAVDVIAPDGMNGTSLAWSEAEKDAVRATFNYISTIVDLTFQEIGDPTQATINFYSVEALGEDTAAYVSFIEPGRSIMVSDDDQIPLTLYTTIHEIGHTLGLAHPHDEGNVIPGVDNQDDPGDFGLNYALNTRMSYVFAPPGSGQQFEQPGLGYAFGAIDIAALHLLYGANTQTGLGDTVYGSTSVFNTIWDNGGSDTIDFSAATGNTVIDLRAATLDVAVGGGGFLSFVSGQNGAALDGGYTIAYGVIVENALGGAGADTMTGNAQANAFTGGAGNDVIDGGDGRDTGIYSGNQASYTLTLAAQNMVLADRRGTDGTDTLSNVELLTFGDAAVAPFDLTVFAGTAGLSEAQMKSFIELYIAYFNRAPDAVGLNFWGTAFANGTTLQQMATLFIDQDETRATYAADLSNSDFATAVYANVLGRVADQEGFDFWVGVLNSGEVGRDQFILKVLEGAKAAPPADATQAFIDQQAADRAYLSTKTDIGTYFAVTRGMSNVDNARQAMGAFDGSANSLTTAIQAIDGYFATAQEATGGEFLMPLVGVVDDPFAAMV